MANKHKTYAELFTAIADSIRTKTGNEDTIVADNFPEEISKISGSVIKDYEQLINYTMLYNEGDECVDVTGGWDASGYSFSTFTINNATENTDSIYVTTTDSALSASGTVNAVDMSEYTGMYFDISVTSINSQNQGVLYYVLDSKTVPSAPPIYGERHSLGKYIEHLDISNKTDLGYVFFTAYGNGSSAYFRHLWMVKADDYITLCSKAGITSTPSSLSELISNTTALSAIFSNEDAMNFMAKQCTGDLMVSILNDATARGLLKNSPYLPYIVGNEHWIKFIMMIPDADELLNVTMLYDEGDECEDITGGWVIAKEQNNTSSSGKQSNCIYLEGQEVAYGGINLNTTNTIDSDGYSNIGYVFSNVQLTTATISSYISDMFTSTKLYSGDVGTSYTIDIKYNAVSGEKKSEVLKVVQTTCYVNAIFLTKPDDLSTLCNKIGILPPDSLEALLEDSSAMTMLMNNLKAIDYLVGCTGDLMIGILQSADAVASASEYAKKVLYNHPIWRKFIDMLGVDLIPAPDEYEQIVNYTMLYDHGDECEEITGGWELQTNSYYQSNYGGGTNNSTKESDHIEIKLTKSGNYDSSYIGGYVTKNKIESDKCTKLFASYTMPSGAVQYLGALGVSETSTADLGVNGYPEPHKWIDRNVVITDKKLLDVDISAINDERYVFMFGHIINPNSNVTLNVYNIWATKQDDISTLCAKAGVSAPADLATLIADTTSLSTIFSNEDAVRFMVAQCTGDFMVSVLNSRQAVGLLCESPYLNLVVANPHWAKFIMMIPNASKGQLVPEEYQQVEYIESSGTQYINTNYILNSDLVEIGITAYGKPQSATSLFGSETSSWPAYSCVAYTDRTPTTGLYIASSNHLASKSFTEGQWNEYVVTTNGSGSGTVSLNGDIAEFSYTNTIQKSLPIAIFANNVAGTAKQFVSIPVKAFYIKDNGIAVRNFIPVNRKSDNVAGLYDIVEGVFYTNNGTGSFVVGGDVSVSPLNYTMLYDEGDECTDVTGGWSVTKEQAYGSFEVAKYDTFIRLGGQGNTSSSSVARAITNNTLDMTSFSKVGGVFTTSGFGGDRNTYFSSWHYGVLGSSLQESSSFVNATKAMSFIDINLTGEGYGRISNWSGWYPSYPVNFFLLKSDDFETWMSEGNVTGFTDLATLVADSTAMATLMSNEEAVKYLVGCTGDLMVSILNDTTAVAAIVNSALATQYLTSHPAWAKFIKMSPTCVDAGLDLLV